MENGGPEFPVVDVYTRSHEDTGEREVMSAVGAGMTLRDWFAGQAASGSAMSTSDLSPSDEATWVARKAYLVADALLAAREG